MWSDLDLITYCSKIYNGENEELTLRAKTFVEKLRKELKQFISCNNEKNLKKNKINSFAKSSNNAGLGFAIDEKYDEEMTNQNNMISLSFDQDPNTETTQKKPSTKLGNNKKKFTPP